MPKLEPVIIEPQQGSENANSNSNTSTRSTENSQLLKSTPNSLANSSSSLNSLNSTIDSSYDPLYAMEYKLTLNHDSTTDDPYSTVKELVLKVFSRNTALSSQHKYNLEISELKGGITNVLLHGTYKATGTNTSIERQFLVRAYGNGTSAIIDRDREFATHLSLYSLGLAPPLYSRFANGLIYGFIPAKSCHYTDLSVPEIMKGVSNKLAEWHVKLDRDIIQSQMVETKRKFSTSEDKFAKNIWDVLYQWVETMPEGIVKVDKSDLKKELVWIKETIGNTSPEVVSHCDLLCGNILVPESWEKEETDDNIVTNSDINELLSSKSPYIPSKLVTFIDYEYAMPAPRGFDLANHFMEWQGFDCKTELIPEPSKTNPILRYWAFHYLSALNHFSTESSQVTDHDIDDLIQELVSWWGMPGFYWGIWSAIQSTISDIDFDYKNYATSRLSEYYAWKQTYTN